MNEFAEIIRSADFSKTEPYERCLCHKLVALKRCRKIFSGVKNYMEILCPDCRANMKEQARIVCVGCGRIAAFLPPQKHACGFVFERSKHYHIRTCSFCAKKKIAKDSLAPVIACPIIELEAFARERHYRVAPDQDIVRHAEQNVLPVDSEFTRMVTRISRTPSK